LLILRNVSIITRRKIDEEINAKAIDKVSMIVAIGIISFIVGIVAASTLSNIADSDRMIPDSGEVKSGWFYTYENATYEISLTTFAKFGEVYARFPLAGTFTVNNANGDTPTGMSFFFTLVNAKVQYLDGNYTIPHVVPVSHIANSTMWESHFNMSFQSSGVAMPTVFGYANGTKTFGTSPESSFYVEPYSAWEARDNARDANWFQAWGIAFSATAIMIVVCIEYWRD